MREQSTGVGWVLLLSVSLTAVEAVDCVRQRRLHLPLFLSLALDGPLGCG